MTYILVSYDISDNHVRLRVSEKLKALGLVRIQRSVFIGRGGFFKAKEVYRGIVGLVKGEADSVFITIIPTNNINRSIVIGRLMANPFIMEKYLVI